VGGRGNFNDPMLSQEKQTRKVKLLPNAGWLDKGKNIYMYK
jgi:hypothetical protein